MAAKPSGNHFGKRCWGCLPRPNLLGNIFSIMSLRTIVKKAAYSAVTALMGDREGFVRIPVVQGPARGLTFRVDLVKRMEAYWHGKYDQDILTTLADRFLKPGMTVWDCGIYIGYYTCFFARAVGPEGRVVAFEPDPTCMARAAENVGINGLENVTWVDAAIGDATGKSAFILSGNTNSHLPGGWVGATEEEYQKEVEVQVGLTEVQVYTLDDAVSVPGVPAPDLVKIDIEGFEGKAVQRTRKLIEFHRPIFVVELHNPECDHQVWQYFHDQGYLIFNASTMRPVTRIEDSRETLVCMPKA